MVHAINPFVKPRHTDLESKSHLNRFSHTYAVML
jgi:hypothetical protein